MTDADGDTEVFVRQPLVTGGIYFDEESRFRAFSTAPVFGSLTAEYATRWLQMAIRPERLAEVKHAAQLIANNRVRYETVETLTGVKCPVVGIINSKEAGLRFDRHLHTGDPLTNVTTHVPKGRPKTHSPPFTWEQSAVDALTLDGLAGNTDWSVEKIAYLLERFNGFGYRSQTPPIPTPDLWAFSNQYDSGHYVADGVFSPTAVAKNRGAMPLLSILMGSSVEGPALAT